MGILRWIGHAFVSALSSVGHSVLELLGLERKTKAAARAAAIEAVNAEIRREWLEIGDARQLKNAGIEYEGEVYYETQR